MEARISEIAAPYIRTGKPGDVLSFSACDNPPGWWTVYRNERPIHHLSHKEDAEALCYAIANAEAAQ